ncbi:uncharacterized protein [Centroberyx affinis]|uniref:uncharacterized protein n=1 Tax=Centroberyx affinis TaxID=166261 RepID=UPI003A5C7456
MYAAMAKHLKVHHNIANVDERKILMNLATGRVNIQKDACPVLGCKYKSARLDRHLKESHSELTQSALEVHLNQAKMTRTKALLASLRATNPAVPVMSGLDLEGEEADEILMEPLEEEEEEEPCTNPSCLKHKQEAKTLATKVSLLEKELLTLRKRYQRLQKKQKRSSPGIPSQLRGVLRAFCGALRSVSRRLVLHQIATKAKKMSQVVSKDTLPGAVKEERDGPAGAAEFHRHKDGSVGTCKRSRPRDAAQGGNPNVPQY